MRKVFLDDLPRKGTRIDWQNSIGYHISFIYDATKGDIEIVNYDKNKFKIDVKYNNEIYNIDAKSLRLCKLGLITKKYTKNFKVNINENIKDDTRDILILNREYRENSNNKTEKWYNYYCNKCGYSNGWLSECKLLAKKVGCSCCNGKTAVLGINTIWDTDRWMCDLGVSEEDAKRYTKGSNKKITVECPDCGRKKEIIINNTCRNKSISCSCRDDGFSFGHKYMCNLLNQLNVSPVENYRPVWGHYNNIYKKRNSKIEYDFFIENMKSIIEVDGNFHREYNRMNGQTKEESEYIDNIKDKLANKNGYNIIRIIYQIGDFKENILNSELKNIFDLSQIDWVKCEEFALKNVVREVCNYWNQKEEWETTTDLARIFNISKHSVIRYLKRGMKLNWCLYNTQEEIEKSLSKGRGDNRIYKNKY
jgi:hypothetical protein